MILQLLFQVILLLLSWPITKTNAKAATPLSTKPNCPSGCGNNVTIPYPFGIGADCYFDELFAIDCKSNKPFLRSIGLEVLNFSLKLSTLRVNQPVSRSCLQNETTHQVRYVSLEKLPFYFSYYDNKFTGIGCNNLASMSSADLILGGCISICNTYQENKTDDDSCNGIKCCQIGVPWSFKSFNISLSSITKEARISGSQQDECKYGFLVETEWFSNNFQSPKDVRNWTQVPVVLDWRIPNSSFDKFAMNQSPTHESSSGCANDSSGLIRCYCNQGYQGNPYFLQGCEDIDECENGTADDCETNMICQNYKGGYRCIPPVRKRSEVYMIILGIGSGFGVLLLLILAWQLSMLIIKRIKQKEENFKRNGGLLLQKQLSSFDGSLDRCKIFNSKELEKATDHFNVNRILGQGGQGTVYKGMLADGRITAVKKSEVVDEAKLGEFINEVVILSQINHRNVVKLLGCCLETKVPLLVYEFIPNGTLFGYLHDHQNDQELPFTWDIRLRIAAEVAEALSYLHSAAYLPVYHRDIKSTNILLDEKYRAKVADFGTSRSIAIDQTHLSTKVKGTFGYFDPEYFHSSQFTDKSDVYSFGVVLVELLTGQKPISSIWAEQGGNLATCFVISMEENRLDDVLDAQVRDMGKSEEIMAVASVAKRCLNPKGWNRPTMKEVAKDLDGIRASEGSSSNVQQNFEKVEFVRTQVIEPWDIVSPSSTSFVPVSS